MSDEEDPFGLVNDAGRTRVRPAPSAARSQISKHVGQGANAPSLPRRSRTEENAFVSAFSELLELAPTLAVTTTAHSAEELRIGLQSALVGARDEAVRLGNSIERSDAAAWTVAALLDDLVLNTPWGGNSDWPRNTLVSSIYGDVDSGSRFFERLDELKRYPDRDPDLLALSFICLSLGFRGKYRVPGMEGSSSLADVHQATARALRNPDRDSAPLAMNWKGVVAENQPPKPVVPIWAMAIAAFAALIVTYMLFSISLSSKSEALISSAANLPPTERSEIFRPAAGVEMPVPASPIEPVTFDLLPFYIDGAPAKFRNLLTGDEDVSTVKLSLQGTNPELFRSSKTDINVEYLPLIEFISETTQANLDVIGSILVVGHTDSIPVQRSNPFESNQGLSEARALSIARYLADTGIPPELIRYEGRAAREPIADNADAFGRARNRRVEIFLQRGSER